MKIVFLLVTLWYKLSVATSMEVGGSFLALAGRHSVVIGTDSNFFSPQTGTHLIANTPRRLIRVGRSVIGCCGLEGESNLLLNMLRDRLSSSMCELKTVSPRTVGRIVSDLLYEGQLYCTPLVAGLNKLSEPWLCSMDGLGAMTVSTTYAAVGSAGAALLGVCDSLFVPDLEDHELVQACSTCFEMAIARECLCGGDIRVLLLNKEGVFEQTRKSQRS